MRKSILGGACLVAALSLLLAGCMSIPIGDGGAITLSNDGVTVSNADGQQSLKVEEKDGEIHYTHVDEEGTVSTSRTMFDEIPEDFPRDIPIPEEAVELTSIKNETDGKNMYILQFQIPNATVYDYYQLYMGVLEQGGYENIIDSSRGNADADLNYVNLSGNSEAGRLLVSLTVTGTRTSDTGDIRVGLSFYEN